MSGSKERVAAGFDVPLWPKNRRAWIRFGVLATIPLAATTWAAIWTTSMPGASHSGALPALTADEQHLAERLRAHVEHLAVTVGPRHLLLAEPLESAAVYVEQEFTSAGYEPLRETFEVRGVETSNVVVELPGGALRDEIVLVGAHYDSIPGCPAANDNASGAAALLEIARSLQGTRPERTLRFVAFTNEEPPYFQTESMGSLVHARAARERGDGIVAMLSLETIGYYDDRPGSQRYPPPFGALYPDTGNFIGFVGDTSSRDLVRRCVESFRAHTEFPSEGAAIPGDVPGIGWSDHWSFWQVGLPAVMVTDTAPFRYRHYHQPSDTPDQLDFERMARVTAGVRRVIEELAGIQR